MRDRITKLAEYEQGGVREYWIIDPLANECLFYHLNSSGKYELISADENDIFRSRVIEGLWIDVNWFRQDPLPSTFAILQTWGLI